jgi:hypothetical protein
VTTATVAEFVSARRAAQIMGIHVDQFTKLVAQGLITQRVFPGLRTTYCRADCERLAALAIRLPRARSKR